jgi:hypothetical protein
MHHEGSVLRVLVEAHHDLPDQETDDVLFECHRTVVAAPQLATMTSQGHDHLSIRLGQGGDGLLQGLQLRLELREFLSFCLPPALELAGDHTMLRVRLIVLCKGTSRFVLDLLHLQAKRVGGLTLSRLIGLRRLETGLSGQRADRLKHLFTELFLYACTANAQTVLASSTTIPPAHVARRRAAFAPRAPMEFAATTATA